MTLTLENRIKVQDKIIVLGGQSGINKRKISKKYAGVIMQVEKKSKKKGEFAMKNNNCIVQYKRSASHRDNNNDNTDNNNVFSKRKQGISI